MNLPAPAQWAIDQVLKLGRTIEGNAQQVRRSISENNGRLMALDQKARQVADPVKRAELLTGITASVRRQAQLAADYRTYSARFADYARRLREFLAARGINESLGTGLGVIPIAPLIVPAAIVTGLLIVQPLIAALASRVSTAGQAISQHERLLKAYQRGELTKEQYREAVDSLEKAADRSQPRTDPLGLANLAEAAMPIALVIAAMVIVPPMLRRRRTA